MVVEAVGCFVVAAAFAFVARERGEWGWWIPAVSLGAAGVYFLFQ
ncbi:MAG TPA: hypothetical protein VNV44_11385 [Solirubrobacteraceae bacterium]|jgi:hypothetical protein|nr:hypothetical protein [Solirubrobacteraceae bacterium]